MGGANSNSFQHTLEVASFAALSNVHVAELDWGARAWVDAVQESYFLTDAIALVPNGTTIIQPAPGAIVGKPSARWVAESASGGAGITTVENNAVPVLPNRNILNFNNSFAIADDAGNLSTDVALKSGPPYTSQADWYIDPVAGNDTAAGTIGAPLKTLTEWANRMGQFTIEITMRVHVLSDLNATDQPMGPINIGASGDLSILGTPVAVQSGTFDTVTTAVPATNTPWSAHDATVTWATAIANGYRILFTAGPSAGGYCWPVLDQGAGRVRLSWPMTADPTLTPYGQSQLNVTANTYTLQKLTHLNIFSLRIANSGTSLESFRIVDCDLGSATAPAGVCSLGDEFFGSSLYACQLQGATFTTGANAINCGSTAKLSVFGNVQWFGGSVVGNFSVDGTFLVVIDYDFMVQTGVVQIFQPGSFQIAACQAFDWSASGAIGGLTLWQGTQCQFSAYVAGTRRLWGVSAVAGTVGIRVQPGSYGEFDTNTTGLTITGANGNVAIGSPGVIKTYAQLPYAQGMWLNTTVTTNADATLTPAAPFSQNFAISDLVQNSSIVQIDPRSDPGAGVGWCSWVNANGSLQIRLFTTITTVNVPSTVWNVGYLLEPRAAASGMILE
jgi:hypothetical protein